MNSKLVKIEKISFDLQNLLPNIQNMGLHRGTWG